MTGLEALNGLIEDLQQDNGVSIICKEQVEKELKAWEILKKKPFESADCINYLTINKNNPNMLDYKHYCMTIKDTLTEEEFNLLKEVLE